MAIGNHFGWTVGALDTNGDGKVEPLVGAPGEGAGTVTHPQGQTRNTRTRHSRLAKQPRRRNRNQRPRLRQHPAPLMTPQTGRSLPQHAQFAPQLTSISPPTCPRQPGLPLPRAVRTRVGAAAAADQPPSPCGPALRLDTPPFPLAKETGPPRSRIAGALAGVVAMAEIRKWSGRTRRCGQGTPVRRSRSPSRSMWPRSR
ncbi:FG-GAP repeat protein [Streptomyces sp. SAI-170]|uniref:FG-GAP repeat protein n=1 Tax=Streptomyces sp. SAI-170 TaxID=3377729 RepID=UPI003C7E643F